MVQVVLFKGVTSDVSAVISSGNTFMFLGKDDWCLAFLGCASDLENDSDVSEEQSYR